MGKFLEKLTMVQNARSVINVYGNLFPLFVKLDEHMPTLDLSTIQMHPCNSYKYGTLVTFVFSDLEDYIT